MYLWERAADESFLELPADGITCEECSKPWNECTCPQGATYDSAVFFDHEEIEAIAGMFLGAWEYSQHLPKDALRRCLPRCSGRTQQRCRYSLMSGLRRLRSQRKGQPSKGFLFHKGWRHVGLFPCMCPSPSLCPWMWSCGVAGRVSICGWGRG